MEARREKKDAVQSQGKAKGKNESLRKNHISLAEAFHLLAATQTMHKTLNF